MRKTASAASLPSNILIEEWRNAFYSREEEIADSRKFFQFCFEIWKNIENDKKQK